jgi:trimethylamine---corrinoid protein Co-methyltransferase
MATSYPIWNDEAQKRVHFETLKVLKNVGIRVDSDESLEIFHSGGAHIVKGKTGGIVRLPEHLVEDCIAWTPKSVIYHGRDEARDFDTKSGKVGFSTFGECVQIFDPYTRKLRPTTKEDCGNTGKIVDYFDELVVMERAVCSTDKMPETQPLHNLEALLKNTSKHIIIAAGSRENCRAMIKMAHIAAGGEETFEQRPIISFSVCASSPLTLTTHTCDVIVECANAGVGMWLISMVLAGGTGPVTLAGSMVQHNAEILGALALAQLVKKGTPCSYGSSSSIMYLKNASSVMGGPEYGMMGRAAADMAKFYDIPAVIATGVSDSKTTDIQSGYETAINFIQVAMSRPPIVYGVGSVESGLTFDLSKVVLDCEHIRHLLMAMDGIPVDDYQLAYHEIREVGPGGTYLLQKQTLDNMRKQSDVTVFDRNPRENWEEKGSPGVLDSACKKAINIIENHTPKALPDGAEEKIVNLIEAYETEINKK